MVTPELLAAYHEARKPGFSPYNDRRMYCYGARSALQQARFALSAKATRAAWEYENGYECDEYDKPDSPADAPSWREGYVRIVAHADDGGYPLDDLTGDTYNPDVNTEIKPEILAAEREAFIDRVNRDGVWFYVAEYWNGGDWQQADSIGMVIGGDLEGSGYDTDLMQSALDGLNSCREVRARDLEAERPDLYK